MPNAVERFEFNIIFYSIWCLRIAILVFWYGATRIINPNNLHRVNRIQPKRQFQNIVQCPFKIVLKKKYFASTRCQSNNKMLYNVNGDKLSPCITNLRVQQNLNYNKWLRHTTTIGCKHCLKNVGSASPRRNDSHYYTSTELMLWEPARTTILFKFNKLQFTRVC